MFFFEPGSQAESNWVIFLFHVASAGVSWWYSPGRWSGLEGLNGFIHMPIALTKTTGNELSFLLPPFRNLRASPRVLSLRVVILLTLWHRAPRNQAESCQSSLG